MWGEMVKFGNGQMEGGEMNAESAEGEGEERGGRRKKEEDER